MVVMVEPSDRWMWGLPQTAPFSCNAHSFGFGSSRIRKAKFFARPAGAMMP